MNSHPPVILIHGFIGTLDVADFASPNATPELLGYGAYRDTPFEQISLPAQVEHLRRFLDTHFDGRPVDVVGHSVGGAIAMLLAHTYPAYVRSIVNVEGNFTLDDAFWSASVGRMTQDEAQAMLDGFRADPLAWLSGAVADPKPELSETARRWLDHQPAATLRAMGRSVVESTGGPDYLAAVRSVFQRHPVHLIAGERSQGGWNAPRWALEQCASYQVLEGCGHLMMLDRPQAFSAALRRCLNYVDAP